MTTTLHIDEILLRLEEATKKFSGYCATLNEEAFFHQPEGRWSPAQQVRHLIIAANNTRLAFSLPKFMVRLYAGKPNRPSRSYDELVAKYQAKLADGGRASGRFVPKPIAASYGKEKMLAGFNYSMQKLSAAIRKDWKDEQLDKYIAPHPLLGKITLRELAYFTVYHTYHHLASIEKMIGN